jgi:hypothetical protein
MAIAFNESQITFPSTAVPDSFSPAMLVVLGLD